MNNNPDESMVDNDIDAVHGHIVTGEDEEERISGIGFDDQGKRHANSEKLKGLG